MSPIQRVGAKLKNAPLVHVLAQVRYEPVLMIERSIAAVQGRLKELGFPRFETGHVQNIVLAPNAAPQVEAMKRWDFLSRDRRLGVVLATDFVTLQTSAYDTFEVFSEQFQQILRVLKEETKIELVQRLGIRYVDLVRPAPGEQFSDYLHPGLVGFPFNEIRGEQFVLSLSNTISTAQTKKGFLVVKCLQNNTGQLLPPDLLPTSLSYSITLRQGETVAILDFDNFGTFDIDFSPDQVADGFNELHGTAKEAFEKAVTSHAFQKWGPLV